MAHGIRYRSQYKKPVITMNAATKATFRKDGETSAHSRWYNTFGRELFPVATSVTEKTYKHPERLTLVGQRRRTAPAKARSRIAFLKSFMADAPAFDTLETIGDDSGRYILAKPGEYYLVYTTDPQTITLELSGNQPYKIDGVDTWNMKIVPHWHCTTGSLYIRSAIQRLCLPLYAVCTGRESPPISQGISLACGP